MKTAVFYKSTDGGKTWEKVLFIDDLIQERSTWTRI